MMPTIASFPVTATYVWLLLVVAYLTFVRKLRFQRHQRIAAPFGAAKRPLSSMTTTEAGKILRELQELEFPFTLHNALSFGLIKTAGIPTISKLLVATGQLNQKNIHKRATDTEVLLVEVQSTDPETTRHLQAIARMNYLHERYRKAGKILNPDMLHTLASGIVEPFRFVREYEWRDLSDVEKCAFGVFHKSLGEAMGVPFDSLPSSRTGWHDGLHFAQEVVEWVDQYEKHVAISTHSNEVLAGRFLGSVSRGIPAPLAGLARQIIITMLDDCMRKAMGLEPPNVYLAHLLRAILTVRKQVLRHLCPPRPSIFSVKLIDESPNPLTGLYNYNPYNSNPMYVKPTLWRRWGPSSWLSRGMKPGSLPGDKPKYRAEGYDLRTIGPAPQEGRGIAEMEETVKNLRSQGRGGCPFHNLGANRNE